MGLSLLVLIIGSWLSWRGFLGAWWSAQEASHWAPVPCVIEEAHVPGEGAVADGAMADDFGRNGLVLRYTFRQDGHSYSGERYSFTDGYAGRSRDWARALVAAHPPGSLTTCWVDPADPHQSVMTRELPPPPWLNLLPLLLVAIGLGGLLTSYRCHRSSESL